MGELYLHHALAGEPVYPTRCAIPDRPATAWARAFIFGKIKLAQAISLPNNLI
jgi:hypothetical protein